MAEVLPNRLRRFGSSSVSPRAAADTRGQYSTLCYAGDRREGRRRGGEKEGRGSGGTGEGGRSRGGEKEGTGEEAKEVAQTAGGEAAGAGVIGG